MYIVRFLYAKMKIRQNLVYPYMNLLYFGKTSDMIKTHERKDKNNHQMHSKNNLEFEISLSKFIVIYFSITIDIQ